MIIKTITQNEYKIALKSKNKTLKIALFLTFKSYLKILCVHFNYVTLCIKMHAYFKYKFMKMLINYIIYNKGNLNNIYTSKYIVINIVKACRLYTRF